MELIGSIFLILALAVVVSLFIGRPFILKAAQKTPDELTLAKQEQEHLMSALLAERDRVLNSLQELDFDYALGKVPAEDYPQQRAVLLKNGAEALRRLDELSAGEAAAATEAAEERIEKVVAARRADAGREKIPQSDPMEQVLAPAVMGTNGGGKDELEELIALRKRTRKESAAGFCPRCGKPAQKSDKFCSKCGAPL